ncbi:MAG: saccharopine dehydrogenase NADP-binding domain-containing protein [Flavobacteriales bacterium]|nr:saccharopine dehydrogenase NADP-binding domain-containing protein [Flavobacteriales bacterium]
MKKILVLGAGRSSTDLIHYLISVSEEKKIKIRVGDIDIEMARQRTGNHPATECFALNASDDEQRRNEISQADLVISMLPALMHVAVAKDCIAAGKNVITPSYVSDEMWTLEAEAKSKGVLLLNEMGVDPGIDHMSAMKIIHHLESLGAVIESFESFTGGLIAPESDDNPWNYKITWNPRNVVLAGYGGTAKYQQDGELKFIPYHRLFERIIPINIDRYGSFDGYANRDSLKYRKIYGLENIPTLLRGTLRRNGFCKAWNVLVQLGLTDDSFEIENPNNITWRQLTASFLNLKSTDDVVNGVRNDLNVDAVSMEKLVWLGIFSDEKLDIEKGTPAVALQKLIEKKWILDSNDKDMLVMWHRFRYQLNGKRIELQSSMVDIGLSQMNTAMSRTVGLPIGIAAIMVLEGKLKLTGIHMPVIPEIYIPVLNELEKFNIRFVETTMEL